MAGPLTPDICVIGGGPGGIAAARAAIGEGATVVLVERQGLGGANLAYGGVPLAALMAAGSVSEALRRGPSLGVSGAPLQVNLGKVREHIVAARSAIAAGMSAAHLMAEGVKVITGRARFISGTAVSTGDTLIRPRGFVLAVGARSAVPELPGITNVDHLSPAEALEFNRKPTHLIVVGATAEGLALAQAHQRLGIDCTVIDQGPVLPEHDPEVVAVLMALLAREGLRIRPNVKVERIARRRGGVRLVLQDAEHGEVAIDASHLLVATARRAAVDGLGLETAGIAFDGNAISVRNLRTANRRVFAIGDAIEGPALVARAEAEGRAAVRAILLHERVGAASTYPRSTLTDPPLAAVGMSEAEARAADSTVRVWRYPLAETDRAVLERVPEGVLKVIASKSGRILGATGLGRDAAENIALWSLAMEARLSLADVARIRAAYPSRAAAARALAERASPGHLTGGGRKRIIRLLGKFG